MVTFFVDGYMGLYDTLSITAGEREQKIELYHWLKGDGAWTGGTQWGEKVVFRYEIANRQFSSYSADVEVSLWRSQKNVRDLISQHVQIDSFDEEKLEWVLDTVELEPGGLPPVMQPYKYSVVLKNGEMERELRFYIYAPPPSAQEPG